ncbi:hypothetical protein D3C84_499010 [compost metagenome]
MLLTCRMQHTIKGRPRGHIASLVSQLWHDLARRQMCIGLAVAERHDTLSLKLAKCVARYRPDRRGASICQDLFRQAPAL